MDMAIVYMAAGMSSRFGGKIKQFAKVGPNDETLIEYSMNQAINAGINKFVFIVGKMTEKPFKEKFGNLYKGISVEYALQEFDDNSRDRPWGTMDALASVKKIDLPFIVCNGDDLYGENTFKILIDHLKENESAATAYYKLIDVLPEKGTTNRGVFKIENEKIADIREVFNIDKSNLNATNSNPDDPANMNLFALHPKDLDNIHKSVAKFKEVHKGDRRIECFLPEEIGKLIKEKSLIMVGYPAKDKWFGITNPGDELVVKEKLKSQENT